MRLDESEQLLDDGLVEWLLRAGCVKQVPGVDDKVDQAEPQERLGRHVALRAGHGLPGRRGGECLRLALRRLDDGRERIVAELIAGELVARLVAGDARQ